MGIMETTIKKILNNSCQPSCIFKSTLRQSQPNKASLKCPSVHMYVERAYVRQSTKCFFDFNEIWPVGRGR